jgi:hypothetical protein
MVRDKRIMQSEAESSGPLARKEWEGKGREESERETRERSSYKRPEDRGQKTVSNDRHNKDSPSVI